MSQMVNKKNHLLSSMGVLASFSISLKMNQTDMKKIKTLPSSKQMETINSIVKKSMKEDLIPGYVLEELDNGGNNANNKSNNSMSDKEINKERQFLLDLTCFTSIISKRMVDKKLDTFHCCFVINTMINMLNLDQEDFAEFHERFREFLGEDEENNTEDYNNEDDDDSDF